MSPSLSPDGLEKKQRGSSVRRRELGRMLRQAIRDRGMTQHEVCQMIPCDDAVLTRILAGERRCAMETAAAVMVAARTTAEHRWQAMNLANEDARDSGWPFYLARGGSRWDVLRHEAGTAVSVTEWAPAQIPWPLQTTAYTRALHDADHPDPGGVEDWLRPRRALTELLVTGGDERTPPRWHFLIHEHALHTPPGPVSNASGPWQRTVMAAQLQRLDRLIVQAAVSIRVVPAHQGVIGGAGFALLEFAHYRAVVYRDEHDIGLFIEDPTIIDTVRADVEGLFRVALPVAESRALIARIAAENYGLADASDEQQRHS
jgi:hypothetical protein